MPSSDLAVHSGVPSGSWETNWWRFYRHRCRERAFSISGLGFWLIWVTQSPHMLPEHKWFINAIIGPCSALGGAFRKLGNQLVKVLPAPMSRTSIFHFWAGILINAGSIKVYISPPSSNESLWPLSAGHMRLRSPTASRGTTSWWMKVPVLPCVYLHTVSVWYLFGYVATGVARMLTMVGAPA